MATSKSNDKWTKEHFLACGFHWSAGEKFIYLGDAGYIKRDYLGIFDHIFWGKCTQADPDGFFKVGEWYDFAVQTTSRGHFNTRRKKMLSANTFSWWTEHPGKRSFLMVWDKVSGKRRYKIEELTMDDWHNFQKKMERGNISPHTTNWTTEDFHKYFFG